MRRTAGTVYKEIKPLPNAYNMKAQFGLAKNAA